MWAVERISDAVKKVLKYFLHFTKKITVLFQAKAAKSILDVDPEARAILEMTGKTRQSEGLREPHIDDDDWNS